jgi:hypothetical protein
MTIVTGVTSVTEMIEIAPVMIVGVTIDLGKIVGVTIGDVMTAAIVMTEMIDMIDMIETGADVIGTTIVHAHGDVMMKMIDVVDGTMSLASELGRLEGDGDWVWGVEVELFHRASPTQLTHPGCYSRHRDSERRSRDERYTPCALPLPVFWCSWVATGRSGIDVTSLIALIKSLGKQVVTMSMRRSGKTTTSRLTLR